MSSITSNPSKPKIDPPQKPLKSMCQQEKLAWKAAQEKPDGTAKDSASSKSTSSATKKDTRDNKDKNQSLRPSTPSNQTGSSNKDDGGNSPASQACTSGTVTPTSEGVRRADRNVRHAPPGGFDG